MNDILKEIAENKKREVSALFYGPSGSSYAGWVRDEAAKRGGKISLKDSILSRYEKGQPGIIAEFKRRSPSKGDIAPMASILPRITAYEAGGAAGCSVLTDTRFFGGALSDLATARAHSGLPLLRKDFIVDENQIYEAAAFGADVILIIASILERGQIESFVEQAHSLNLEVLYEIHTPDELDKMPDDVDMLGVNNRRLSSFVTDVRHSADMIGYLPHDRVLVAESGITSVQDVRKLMQMGYQGFLIGEALMRNGDPAGTLGEFIYE